MPRLLNKTGAGYKSSTHLLWLAIMGLKETHFAISQRISDKETTYNAGIYAVAVDILGDIMNDNNKK